MAGISDDEIEDDLGPRIGQDDHADDENGDDAGGQQQGADDERAQQDEPGDNQDAPPARPGPAQEERQKSNRRCGPCTVRNSRCDRFLPSCGPCVQRGTTAGCFGAAGLPQDPAQARQARPPGRPPGRPRRNQQPPPPPADPSSDPEDPPPPPRSASSRRSSIASTMRPATASERSRSPAQTRATRDHSLAASPFPRIPRNAAARAQAAADLQAALAQLEQAQARLDALNSNAASVASAAPAPAPRAPAPSRGLNVGTIQGVQQPRAPIAIGVIADADFTFVPQTIVDLFLKKNWCSHVSLVYLTDAYCKQSNAHLTATTYKTRIDPITNETVYVAQPLPDLNEHAMAYVDWSRAFQRFIAILRSIGHPWVERWVLHEDIIKHHPLTTVNWPLVLAYDIAIRRRSVNHHELDMGIFQHRIFEDCRTIQHDERFEELTKAASAAIAQARQAPSTSKPRASPMAPAARPSPRTGTTGTTSFLGKCFACGGEGHRPMDCTNAPLLASQSGDGKWTLDVTPNAKGTTSAPCADPRDTEPKPALGDPRRIVTPLVADAWETALAEAGILDQFRDLLTGLRNGFDIGVSSTLDSTIIHPNHKSATDRPEIIQKHIAKEVEAGRYSGPFSPYALFNLIGHFRASPLGVVDKPSSPGDFRIIQDFSFPRDDPHVQSVNSEINALDFICSWGFFSDVVAILLGLPPGSQAATLDVEAAYRRMPVQLAHQVHIIVHWLGQCWVDHCVPFGGVSSGGIFGRCGDALLQICMARGFGPAVKWVDDFLFFRSPTPGSSPPAFLYSLDDLYKLAEFLGIPWKIAKTKPFATWFIYLGFLWDIPSRRVSIPPEKRTKFANKIREWLNKDKVSLRDTQSLLGSLIHCSLAMPEGRSRVVGISRFTASFSHRYQDRFKTRERSARATEDAKWWLNQLMHSDCGSFLMPKPPRSDVVCFMDASTSFGVGIMIDNEFASWKLKPGWQSAGRDIGWAEIVAIELTVCALIQRGLHDRTVTLHSDNQGVIGALRAGHSRNDQQNTVLQRIVAASLAYNLFLEIEYVATDKNPADAPSRGVAPIGYEAMTVKPRPHESLKKWLASALGSTSRKDRQSKRA